MTTLAEFTVAYAWAWRTGLSRPGSLGVLFSIGDTRDDNRIVGGLESVAHDASVFVLRRRLDSDEPTRIRVGRDPAADVYIPCPSVSKRHAYFSLTEGGALGDLFDAGSSNGTFVGRTRVSMCFGAALSHGAVVRFARHAFLFGAPGRLEQLVQRWMDTRTSSDRAPRAL